MNRVARLLCLVAVLSTAGCYVPDYVLRPKIVRGDANGVVIVGGSAINPYNIAALHCQHYGKLSVPRGTQPYGEHSLTFYYACE